MTYEAATAAPTGKPHREPPINDHIGHRAGDEVGKEAAATGRSIREIVVEKGLLDEGTVDRLLSITNLIQHKKTLRVIRERMSMQHHSLSEASSGYL